MAVLTPPGELRGKVHMSVKREANYARSCGKYRRPRPTKSASTANKEVATPECAHGIKQIFRCAEAGIVESWRSARRDSPASATTCAITSRRPPGGARGPIRPQMVRAESPQRVESRHMVFMPKVVGTARQRGGAAAPARIAERASPRLSRRESPCAAEFRHQLLQTRAERAPRPPAGGGVQGSAGPPRRRPPARRAGAKDWRSAAGAAARPARGAETAASARAGTPPAELSAPKRALP